jgi:hypothetical protein
VKTYGFQRVGAGSQGVYILEIGAHTVTPNPKKIATLRDR